MSEQLVLFVRVLEARDLLPADANGYSDPYCVVKMKTSTSRFSLKGLHHGEALNKRNTNAHLLHVLKKKQERTRVSLRTLDPVWLQDFQFHLADIEADYLVVKVYDWDRLSRDDFLGKVKVPMRELVRRASDTVDDDNAMDFWHMHRWFDLYDKKMERRTRGEINLKIAAVPMAYVPHNLGKDEVLELLARESKTILSFASPLEAHHDDVRSYRFHAETQIAELKQGVAAMTQASSDDDERTKNKMPVKKNLNKALSASSSASSLNRSTDSLDSMASASSAAEADALTAMEREHEQRLRENRHYHSHERVEHHQLDEHIDDGMHEVFNVCVATWNVGNEPPPADLTDWLPHEIEFEADDTAHERGVPLDQKRQMAAKKREVAQRLAQMPTVKRTEGNKAKLTLKRHPSTIKFSMSLDANLNKLADGDIPEEVTAPAVTRQPVDVVVIGAQECQYVPRPIPPGAPIVSFHDIENRVVSKSGGGDSGADDDASSILGDDDSASASTTHSAKTHKSCRHDWMSTLQAHLGSEYVPVAYNDMWEIRLAIFVLRKHEHKVRHIEVSREATGIGRVLGNKGAVAVSMDINHTSFCFISSHLAAHQHKTAQRNRDVQEIIEGLNLGDKKMDVLNQFHHVFWVGDLNYRINYNPDKQDKTPSKEEFDALCTLIQHKQYEHLFRGDQLAHEMRRRRAFVGFREGNMATFPPTFKVVKHKEGSSQFHSVLEYNSKRAPAWTDRILFKSARGFDRDVQQMYLNAALNITTSDHKPVSSLFRVRTFTLPSCLDSTRGECSIAFLNLRAHLRDADKLGVRLRRPSFSSAVADTTLADSHKKVSSYGLDVLADVDEDEQGDQKPKRRGAKKANRKDRKGGPPPSASTGTARNRRRAPLNKRASSKRLTKKKNTDKGKGKGDAEQPTTPRREDVAAKQAEQTPDPSKPPPVDVRDREASWDGIEGVYSPRRKDTVKREMQEQQEQQKHPQGGDDTIVGDANEAPTEDRITSHVSTPGVLSKSRHRRASMMSVPQGSQVKANPFVKFSAPFLLGTVSTEVKRKTYEPRWNNSGDVPRLFLKTNSIERLRKELLHVRVMHQGTMQKSAAMLGQGVITFADLNLVDQHLLAEYIERRRKEEAERRKQEQEDQQARGRHGTRAVKAQSMDAMQMQARGRSRAVANPEDSGSLTDSLKRRVVWEAVSIPFATVLTLGGLIAGTLKGTMQLFWDDIEGSVVTDPNAEAENAFVDQQKEQQQSQQHGAASSTTASDDGSLSSSSSTAASFNKAAATEEELNRKVAKSKFNLTGAQKAKHVAATKAARARRAATLSANALAQSLSAMEVKLHEFETEVINDRIQIVRRVEFTGSPGQIRELALERKMKRMAAARAAQSKDREGERRRRREQRQAARDRRKSVAKVRKQRRAERIRRRTASREKREAAQKKKHQQQQQQQQTKRGGPRLQYGTSGGSAKSVDASAESSDSSDSSSTTDSDSAAAVARRRRAQGGGGGNQDRTNVKKRRKMKKKRQQNEQNKKKRKKKRQATPIKVEVLSSSELDEDAERKISVSVQSLFISSSSSGEDSAFEWDPDIGSSGDERDIFDPDLDVKLSMEQRRMFAVNRLGIDTRAKAQEGADDDDYNAKPEDRNKRMSLDEEKNESGDGDDRTPRRDAPQTAPESDASNKKRPRALFGMLSSRTQSSRDLEILRGMDLTPSPRDGAADSDGDGNARSSSSSAQQSLYSPRTKGLTSPRSFVDLPQEYKNHGDSSSSSSEDDGEHYLVRLEEQQNQDNDKEEAKRIEPAKQKPIARPLKQSAAAAKRPFSHRIVRNKSGRRPRPSALKSSLRRGGSKERVSTPKRSAGTPTSASSSTKPGLKRVGSGGSKPKKNKKTLNRARSTDVIETF